MPPDPKHLRKKLDDLRSQLDRLGYGPGGSQPASIISGEELRQALGTKRPKRPAPPQPTKPPLAPLVLGRLPAPSGKDKPTPAKNAVVQLEDSLAGEVAERTEGKFYRVVTPTREVEGADGLAERFADLLHEPGSSLRRELHSRLPEVTEYELEHLVFMDIETTGLSCSPLFLIGIMVWTGDGFEVRQFLARHYGEERAVVAEFLEEQARRPLLVTFNGKTFDYPYIRSRATVSGLSFADVPAHLDLLHVSRRFWRRHFPNCKLQTLERHLCQRVREGDIPGAEIPDAYHAYVRTGNAYQIVDILKHNLLDLVTLADLMTHFPDEA